MENLSVASEASKRYILGANSLGSTLGAIIEVIWYNWIVKATDGQNPTGIYPWTAWSSRFVLQCKANNETNSTIFTKMRKRGSDIPGEYWVKVVLEEHRFIENELARGCDTHDDAAL